jgi:hypothetical protein
MKHAGDAVVPQFARVCMYQDRLTWAGVGQGTIILFFKHFKFT